MKQIKMVSLMSGNADLFYRKLADYLTWRTGIEVSVVDDVCWRERERMLDCGLAEMGFICGLQYVRKADGNRGIKLLAAPVMQLRRYRGKPIYFSDIVVHCDSPFHSLRDLRGRSWACNEPTSHSGCNLIRYHLAVCGEDGEYFGQVVESGSHQNSLTMVLDGRMDAAAIDSTVLELEMRMRPELRRRIRIIETLGPSPIPPAVISSFVPRAVKDAMRNALLLMHKDDEGKAILTNLSISHFVQVEDSDYEPIRRMAQKAHQVSFLLSPTLTYQESKSFDETLAEPCLAFKNVDESGKELSDLR